MCFGYSLLGLHTEEYSTFRQNYDLAVLYIEDKEPAGPIAAIIIVTVLPPRDS